MGSQGPPRSGDRAKGHSRTVPLVQLDFGLVHVMAKAAIGTSTVGKAWAVGFLIAEYTAK